MLETAIEPSREKQVEPVTGTGCSAQLGSARVFVADSRPAVTDRLAALLAVWGYDVRLANSAADAIEVCADFRPRIALLDPMLGGPDLSQLARRLRRKSLLVAMTNDVTCRHLNRCLQAGYIFHLAQPVAANELEALMEALRRPYPIPGLEKLRTGRPASEWVTPPRSGPHHKSVPETLRHSSAPPAPPSIGFWTGSPM